MPRVTSLSNFSNKLQTSNFGRFASLGVKIYTPSDNSSTRSKRASSLVEYRRRQQIRREKQVLVLHALIVQRDIPVIRAFGGSSRVMDGHDGAAYRSRALNRAPRLRHAFASNTAFTMRTLL